MTRKQSSKRRTPVAPISYSELTRTPLQSLIFLLPLVFLFEAAMYWRSLDGLGDRPTLAAPQLLRFVFSLFGITGYYLPGICLLVVMLCIHIYSRRPWRFSLSVIPVMAAESLLWGLPLLIISDFIQHKTLQSGGTSLHQFDDMLLGIGAGIYEELVFRVILITLVMIFVDDVIKKPHSWGMAAAVIISSLLFAAHHYPPIGKDTLHKADFIFRTIAGGYLAAIFLSRGIGIAVGAHASYNVVVALLRFF